MTLVIPWREFKNFGRLDSATALASGAATALSMSDFMGEWVCPEMFGAVGNGVTDDTAAIQAALNASTKVWLRGTTYLTSAALTYGINQHIVGVGHVTSIISGTHAGDILRPADVNVAHRGMHFAHFALTKSANTGAGAALRLGSCRSSIFDSLELTQCNIGLEFKTGRQASYSYFNEFRNLVSFSNTTNAVWIGPATDSIRFSSGGTYQVVAGNTITGAITGATATVDSVELTGGTWAAGSARGHFVLSNIVGKFSENENLDVGANSNVASTEANDIPNANLLIGGDWRGGSKVLHVVNAGGLRFIDTSIQGASAGGNWAHLEALADGTVMLGCRFENPSTDPLTVGLNIEGPGCQIIGGTSSKGGIKPYLGDVGETVIVGHRAGGQPIYEGKTPYYADRKDGQAEWSTHGGVGKYQNLLVRSNNFGTASWARNGTYTRTSGQTDRFGGTDAYKYVAVTDNPSFYQVTGIAAASQTVCFAIWVKGDTQGFIQLGLEDEGATAETEEATARVLTEWSRVWVFYTFSSGATGNIVVRVKSDGDSFLDTIYVDDASLVYGTRPGIDVLTTSAAVTGSDRVVRYDGADLDATLRSYTVSTLPAAASNTRRFLWCSDETGGPVPVYSDGTNWRRVSDGAIAS